jgi:hypothetical protein
MALVSARERLKKPEEVSILYCETEEEFSRNHIYETKRIEKQRNLKLEKAITKQKRVKVEAMIKVVDVEDDMDLEALVANEEMTILNLTPKGKGLKRQIT